VELEDIIELLQANPFVTSPPLNVNIYYRTIGRGSKRKGGRRFTPKGNTPPALPVTTGSKMWEFFSDTHRRPGGDRKASP